MRDSEATVDVAAVVFTSAVLLLVGLGVSGWVRTVAALVFATFVPGWALIGHAAGIPRWARLAVGVGLSLALCTAAALVMVWLEEWRPYLLFNVLAGASLAALLAHLALDSRT